MAPQPWALKITPALSHSEKSLATCCLVRAMDLCNIQQNKHKKSSIVREQPCKYYNSVDTLASDLYQMSKLSFYLWKINLPKGLI